MKENVNAELDKLKDLCTPVIEYLKDNYNHYTKLIISEDCIEMVITEVGIPMDSKND